MCYFVRVCSLLPWALRRLLGYRYRCHTVALLYLANDIVKLALYWVKSNQEIAFNPTSDNFVDWVTSNRVIFHVCTI